MKDKDKNRGEGKGAKGGGTETPGVRQKNGRDPLLQSHFCLCQVFEYAMDGVFVIDLKGRYRDVNPAGCSMFGYTLEEFLKSDISLLLFPEDVEKAFGELNGERTEAGKFIPEYRMRKKDGTEVWVEMTVKPLKIGEEAFLLGIKRDITVRRRATSAVRGERDRAQRYLDVAGVMLLVIDTNEKISMINKKGCEILGSTESDITGRNWFDNFIPADRRTAARAVFKKILSGDFGSFEYMEDKILTKRGEERTIDWHNAVLRDEEGRVYAALSSGKDITERKRAEEELIKARRALEERVRERTAELVKVNEALISEIKERKRSMEMLQAVMDNSMAVIYVKDKDGRFVLINRWYETLFKVSREEIVGRTDYDIFPKDIADSFRENDLKVLEANRALEFEESALHPDGTVHTYISVKFPAPAFPGMICGISTDITERKRAEEELKRGEDRFNEAQRIARMGNWDWDIARNTLFWSDEIYRIFGLKPQEFGATFEAFLNSVHPDDRELVKGSVNAALYKKEAYDIDHRILLPDGAERVVHEHAHVTFDKEGKPVRMAGTVQDVTERKKMEEEILKAQKLESIGDLAGGIAHDFNNILLGILGNVSIAKTCLKPDDRVSGILSDVEKAAQRAKSLTRQLLTFSRGGEPVREPAAIEQLIRDSAGLVLRGSNVECEFSFPKDLWQVEVDEGQISQVINNVILNAQQAMPQGGMIRVSAENVAISSQDTLPLKSGNYVKVTVTDYGAGIHPKIIHKIFDPFFTTKQKASGLGLAVSYSIIKKHNGYICAESRPGAGTSFHIYLPAHEREAAGKAQAEVLVKGRGRILVMDDEELVRDVTGEMLKLLGYEAEFAAEGKEAIEKFVKALSKGEPFDAAILDLTIPGGMGGKETVKALLEIDPGLKAVVSSGYSKDPIMSDFKKYGFCGVIAKPYRVTEFSRIIKGVISGEQE